MPTNDNSILCHYGPPQYSASYAFLGSSVGQNFRRVDYKFYNGNRYIDRCDYIVRTQRAGCFSDPLIIYTDNPQTPQLRKGLGDSLDTNTEIKLYPNPANDRLTIETGLENFKIQLLNLYGSELLYKEANTPSTDIDLSSFANGMYFVNIITNEKTTRRKIEVMR